MMYSRNKKRPLVKAVRVTPVKTAIGIGLEQRGAKNTWVGPGCQIYIATYNARTLGKKEKLVELEYELGKMKWNTRRISEIRRKAKDCLTLRSGHFRFHKGNKEKT